MATNNNEYSAEISSFPEGAELMASRRYEVAVAVADVLSLFGNE